MDAAGEWAATRTSRAHRRLLMQCQGAIDGSGLAEVVPWLGKRGGREGQEEGGAEICSGGEWCRHSIWKP